MLETNNLPNMELGKIVVGSLISERLILPENQESILSKVCGGTMKASDWKSFIETKILKDESKVDDGKSDQED